MVFDEQQLRASLQGASIDDRLTAITAIGKQGLRTLAGDIVPFLRDPHPELRAAAIRTLGFYWRLPDYKAVAKDMWSSDPDEETRSVALMSWSGYDQSTRSPETIRQLYQLLCDDAQPDIVRDVAYGAMFSVMGVPHGERPKGAMSIGRPIEDGVDWTRVDHVIAESSAATFTADPSITAILYAHGSEYDLYAGRVALTVFPDEMFEAEYRHHDSARSWRGTLQPGAWRLACAAIELDRFPVSPKEHDGVPPGTQFDEIGWRRNDILEQITFPAKTPRYRDVERFANAILSDVDGALARLPNGMPKLLAAVQLL